MTNVGNSDMELHQDALLTTVGNETLRDDRSPVDCWYFSFLDTVGGLGSEIR